MSDFGAEDIRTMGDVLKEHRGPEVRIYD